MKGMNDIICTMQENVEHITGKLCRVMFAKDCLEELDGKINNYMGQRFGTLELVKGQLDKLAMYLVEDLNEELSEALADIEADEEEVDAYAAMYDEEDFLPEANQDSQELEELLEKEEQAAKDVTLEEIEQEGGTE